MSQIDSFLMTQQISSMSLLTHLQNDSVFGQKMSHIDSFLMTHENSAKMSHIDSDFEIWVFCATTK